MSTATPAPGLGSIVTFGRMIRFSHTVFALPFAFSGVLFAVHERGAWPPWTVWLWVVVAMVGARTAAMAFNRLVDADIDSRNPRTRNREIPSGAISRRTAGLLILVAVGLFEFAAWRLNPLAFALSPLALAVVLGYSYTKRFTWLSHMVLGLGLAFAPVGGWIAVQGSLSWPPVLVGLAVATWVAGFDVFYALQDLEFDRRHGLQSIPARFGVPAALRGAAVLHGLTVAALAAAGLWLDLGVLYFVGVTAVAGILVYEHRLVRPDDLSRLNKAFFDMNAVISVVYLGASIGGVLWR